ncbi:hypothetical protein K1T71_002156 [Dendrolimus kikuchii]|uniref:Uncharacterized protein n=1 Tax=Dendrolimus kikuchii TaxID=765133 RepID=A0ACC1DGP5_9NEOP|nr:hypothetical protein K1T71_002156 [Dendrolimus kikuchii]
MDLDDTDDDIDGSIRSIHVKNFFCHENLEINLNRNVNFIVGRNGSGKSAILTALVVGLGSRASVTNRGSNLHSFIKKGANSASISIKIKNNSPRAYKHNIYGDYITIVRNINASGGSSYKVKSATGEVISTKFEEVNAVILAHDIQVDNPISVLNQDDARSFHASDARKKYLLYRKATNLDQTETNYVRALENCNKANALWKKKTEASLELEKEYKKWKTSYEQLQSRDEIENQKKALQNEYYWSEIADLERNTNSIQSQYDKQKAKMEKLAEKLSKMEEHFGSQNGVIDVLKTQLDEKCLEKTALEQELRDLESEVREVQGTSRSAQQSLAKHQEHYKREQRKVADLEREIHNIDSGSVTSRRAQLEATASAAAASAEAARARYETAQNDAQQARANVAHAQAQADQAAARAQKSRDSLRQLKQQLRELESRGNDSLAVYGNNMVELCQRVSQAVARGEFSAPPKGPVGAYIKVKERKWGGALEHIIGGSIKSFCVNTPEDSRKLFEIMGQVYGNAAKPSVTCSKFLSKQHDVRRNKVHAKGFLSALDSIDVSDPVVANFLIDNVAMERILLVPNHDDAVRLSDSEENVPNNCAKIVTLDSTEFHPAPNYRSYGGANRTSRFLLISTAERKRQLMSEIGEAQQTLQALEAQAEDLNQEVKRARDNERATSRALQALLAENHEKDEAARVAAAALDQQQAPHHAVLVDELKISKESLKTLKEQIDVYSKKDDSYRKKIDEYDIRMKRNKTQLGEVTTACRDLNEEIEQEQMKLEQGVTECKTYQQRVKEDKTKLAQVEAILGEKKAAIDLKVQQALTLCPRVEDPRDIAIVSNELKKIQLKLSSIRSDGLTKAQVGEQLLLVKNKYKKTKETLDRLKLLIDNIRKTADEHLKFCRMVQSYIANRVQYCFQSILTLRGYSGSMNIDNGESTLEIQCTGRESGERRHAASTSSLSGGERSYSTVAFIMALWDCVELPFYFMDEFDVFMDNVNRKIVMELLIDHALKNTNRQFVFLTPQDTSSVVASEQISIHLMANPRP